MNVSVIVSKNTLNQLDQFLIYHQNQFIKKLEEEHQIGLDSYLIQEKKIRKKKSSSQNKSCCLARVWNKGYGGQCTRFKKECQDYCLLHLKQYQNGHLPHGRIDTPCPKILPRLRVQPFAPTKTIKIKKIN